MISMNRDGAPWRHRLLPVLVAPVLLMVVVASGCDTGEDSQESGSATATEGESVDSTLRFHGQRRAIARVIEDYETAIRAGNASRLCRRVLELSAQRPRSKEVTDCVADPDNDVLVPRSGDAETLDLVVRRIALPPRRPGAVPGIPSRVPRYKIEWGLEDIPSAVALARATGAGRGVATAFGLSRRNGDWRIVSRWRARAVEPPEGNGARLAFFRRHGLVGFYGISRPGLPTCGHGAGITHWIIPPDRARNARDAVMRSNIGNWLRRALRDGAELRISEVDYAGPTRTFTLYGPLGHEVLSFDAYGPGPGYVMDGIYGCEAWIERLTRIRRLG